MTPEETYHEIERYLAGELTGDALAAFEEKLKEEEFASEVALHKHLDLALGDGNREKVESIIASVDLEVLGERGKETADAPDASEEPAGKQITFRTWMAIAATIAVLFLVGFFIVRGLTPQASPQELYAAYYEPYAPPTDLRDPDSLLTAKFSQGLTQYKTGEIEEAQRSFEAILTEAPDHPTARYFLGLCALAQADATSAIPHFSAVIEEGQSLFIPQAHWYLALAHLNLDQADKAKPHLQFLADRPTGRYKKEAGEILKKL